MAAPTWPWTAPRAGTPSPWTSRLMPRGDRDVRDGPTVAGAHLRRVLPALVAGQHPRPRPPQPAPGHRGDRKHPHPDHGRGVVSTPCDGLSVAGSAAAVPVPAPPEAAPLPGAMREAAPPPGAWASQAS